MLLSVFSIVRRRRPEAGGVLPARRPTQRAGERLLPALQAGVQPELPGGGLPLPVPLERGRVAGGELTHQARVWGGGPEGRRGEEALLMEIR